MTYLFAVIGAILLYKALPILFAMGSRTRLTIFASWIMVAWGGFGLLTAPLFMAAIPVIPAAIALFGECGLLVFSKREVRV